jgi:type III restriction enzyme
VNFWTAKDVREVTRCHLNYVVADTKKWEQSAAYLLDTHPAVAAFVKNEGMGFAVPYFHDGQDHDYYPDFLVRLACEAPCFLILEVKGYERPLEDVKRAAVLRWVAAVNADGRHRFWQYRIVKDVPDVGATLAEALEAAKAKG